MSEGVNHIADTGEDKRGSALPTVERSTCGMNTVDEEAAPGHQSQQIPTSPEKPSAPPPARTVTWKGVLLYGICTLMGSHFNNWSIGLAAGFWEYIGIMLIIMAAFGCVALCVAEMTAALPFSGGTYGVVRVTLGDLAGYLIGTTETFQYILYVAFNTVAMGAYVTTLTGYDEKYEPVYWLFIYAAIVVILTFHKQLYWRSMTLFGTYICVMILLYCTMTRKDADFKEYTHDPEVHDISVNQRVYNFFEFLPHGSWFFGLAAKIMPLACVETVNPTVNVPKAIWLSYALAIVSAFCIIFSATSIAPGVAVLRKSTAPLSFGFAHIFHTSHRHAVAFTLVAKFATCLCFSFAYSTQIVALAKSGFLWRSEKSSLIPEQYSEFVSILTGSSIGYIIMLVIWFWNKEYKIYLSNGYLLLGYSINVVIFITYISFRYKFKSLVKSYESPFGIPGAIFGSIVFIIVFVSVGALQDQDRYTRFVLLTIFMIIWTVPYYTHYRHHAKYSEEEGTILFIAYVIRSNASRRARRNAKHSPSSANSSPYAQKKMKQRPPLPMVVHKAVQGNEDGGGDTSTAAKETKRDDAPTLHTASVPAQSRAVELLPLAAARPPPLTTSGRPAPAAHAHAGLPPPDLTMRLPFMDHGRDHPGDRVAPLSSRVAPLSARETEESRERRVADLNDVLANEFQYEQEAMQGIKGEIAEFYEYSMSSAGEEDDEDEGGGGGMAEEP